MQKQQGERKAAKQPDVELVRQAVALGRRHGFDEAHANQVTRLALLIFDELEPLHRSGTAGRRLLTLAALLHDIGMCMGLQKHHKNSFRLIVESGLPDLNQHELLLVAHIARYHRKAEPAENHVEYMRLEKADREKVNSLAALLRLADVLDRDHNQRVQNVTASVGDDEVVLQVTGKSVSLADTAVLQRKSALFERIFARRVRFTLSLTGEENLIDDAGLGRNEP